MADVAISRPAANERQTIQSQPDAKYIFDFQAGDATVNRDGNNLLLNFDDGSGVVIENFYETHTQESMPTFQIDGQEVTGQAFFEALNEPDLMPAAGPAAGTTGQGAQRGGRYNEYGNSDLGGGLDHLTRLDYESDRGTQWENPTWITSPDGDLYANNELGNIPVNSTEPLPPTYTPEVPPTYTPEQPAYTPTYTPPTYVPPTYVPPVDTTPPPVTPPVDYTPPEPVRDIPPVVPPTDTTPPGDVPTIDNPPRDPETPPTDGTPPGTVPPGTTPPGETPPPDLDQPGGSNFIPATGASHVVVDEGALQPEGSAIHKWHGEGGNYYFQSYIPPEEGGTIVLTGVDESGGQITMTFTVNADGSFATEPVISDASGEVMESGVFMSANGVELSNFTLSGGENGHWVVNYDYRLTANQYHDKQGSQSDSDYSTDTVNFDQAAILITVTDGSGDTVNSQINVEVHDDVPVISVERAEFSEADFAQLSEKAKENFVDSSSIRGEFEVNYGADGAAADKPLQIQIDNGELLDLNFSNGQAIFEIEGKGFLKISEGSDGKLNYVFTPIKGYETSVEAVFTVSVKDSDQDVANAATKVDINFRPNFIPEIPPTDPDDEPKLPPTDPNGDPGKPVEANPDGSGLMIRVDEASLVGKSDANASHGHEGEHTFAVKLNGNEDGTVTIGGENGITLAIAHDAAGNYIIAGTEGFTDGQRVFEANGMKVSFSETGLSIDNNGQVNVTFSYELTANQTHDKAEDYTHGGVNSHLDALQAMDLDVVVIDSVGNDQASGHLTFEIHDDGPQVTAGEAIQLERGDLPQDLPLSDNLEGMTLAGNFTVDYGADNNAGQTMLEIDGVKLAFVNGVAETQLSDGIMTITDNGDGSYSYSFAPSEYKTGERVFEVKATDSDGDIATAEIAVNLDFKPEVPPATPPTTPPEDPDKPGEPDPNPNQNMPEGSSAHIVVDEGALAGGTGTGDTAHGATGTGSFLVRFNGSETGTIKIGEGDGFTIDVSRGDNQSFEPVKVSVADGVDVFITGLTKGDGEGEYKVQFRYELTKAFEHDQKDVVGADDYKPGTDIPIFVTDSTNDTAEGKITVEIHDDGPVLNVQGDRATSGKIDLTSDAIPGHEYTVAWEGSLTGSLSALFGADNDNTKSLTINGQAVDLENGSLVYEDKVNGETVGRLHISRNEDGTYRYEYKPAEGHEAFEPKNFNVLVTDSDGDTAPGVITVYQNMKPDLIPNKPEKPGEPGDDPNDPVNYDPAINGLVITVDEAALGDGTGGTGDTDHRSSGTASFVAKFNGGEDGTITIGDDYVITVTNTNGHYDFSASKGEMMIDGVKVSFDPSQISVNDKGEVTINFEYALTEAQSHKDGAGEVGANDVLPTGIIPVKIVDSVKGDSAEGAIRFEIHDDGPKLTVTGDKASSGTIDMPSDAILGHEYPATWEASLTGRLDALFGADIGDTKSLTIEGKPVNLVDGTLDYEDVVDGKTVGILHITRDENGVFKYEYKPTEGHETFAEKSFNVLITDSDGDTAPGVITVYQNMKPNLVPKDPDDENNKSVNADPETGSLIITVDEAALAGNAAGTGDTEHGYTGNASFVAKFNGGEDGTITIGDNYVITVTNTNGHYDFSASKGEMMIDGVKVSFDPSQISVNDKGEVTINFEYALTEAQSHKDGAGEVGANDVLPTGIIPVKIVDSHKNDEAEGTIRFEIHDDGPKVTLGAYEELTLVEGEQAATTSAENGISNIGADNGPSSCIKYSLSATGESGVWVKNDAGVSKQVELKPGEDGSLIGEIDGVKVLTVTIDDDGKVRVNQEPGYAIQHDANGAHQNSVTLNGIKATLTATDSDGDTDSQTRDIVIKIEDTAPELDFGKDSEPVLGSGYSSLVTVDFQNPDMFTRYYRGVVYTNKNLPDAVGNLSNINFWGTHLVYTMTEDGHMDWISDHYSDFGANNSGNLVTSKDIWASLTGPGLGVGLPKETTNLNPGPDPNNDSPRGTGLGIGNNMVTSSDSRETREGAWHSEGIMVDPANGRVNYGLNVTLNSFSGDQDRAAIAFYLTPNSNDDNNLVKTVEIDMSMFGRQFKQIEEGNEKFLQVQGTKYSSVTYDANDCKMLGYAKGSSDPIEINMAQAGFDPAQLQAQGISGLTWDAANSGTITVNIEVPDGFTKLLIGTIPAAGLKPEHGSNSGFWIQKLEFTAPCVTREGSVEVIEGADTADVKDVAWDWSAVEAVLKNGVNIEGALVNDHYDVSLNSTVANTIIATLGGRDEPYSLTGNPLFTATLGEDGHWKITQFYKFTTADGNQPAGEALGKVKFTIEDSDGSVATAYKDMDLTLDIPVNRFDNVEYGYWDQGAKPAEGTDWLKGLSDNLDEPHFDTASDVLQGSGTNDLMYGRGGHDLMFGDQLSTDKFNEFRQLVLGDNSTGVPDEYSHDQGQLASGDRGKNAPFNDDIFNHLNTLVEKIKKGNKTDATEDEKAEAKAAERRLEEIVKAAEGDGNIGDDALFGGTGNDVMFGGAGDDYLAGIGHSMDSYWTQTDHNMLFGGSGRDILVYAAANKTYEKGTEHAGNQGDIIVDGGEGIDVLLVGSKYTPGTTPLGSQTNLSLNQMLNGTTDTYGPLVRNVEIMFRTNKSDDPATSGITSLNTLANYGILISGNTIYLDEKRWTKYYDADEPANPNHLYNYNSPNEETGGAAYSLEIVNKDDVCVSGVPANKFAEYVKNGAPAEDPNAGQPELAVLLEDEDLDIAEAEDLETVGSEPSEKDEVGADAAVAAMGIALVDQEVELDENIWESEFASGEPDTPEDATNESKSGTGLDASASEEQSVASADTITTALDELLEMEDNGTLGNIYAADQDPAAASLVSIDTDTMHLDMLLPEDNQDLFAPARDNEILVVDKSDIFIDGSMNVDVVVTADTDLNLKDMLEQGQKEQIDPDAEMPAMRDVDVLIKGEGLDSIASAGELAEKYGVKINEDGKGIELSEGWTPIVPDSVAADDSASIQVATYEYGTDEGKVTLETTLVRPPLQEVQDAQAGEESADALVPDSEDADAVPGADNDEEQDALASDESLDEDELASAEDSLDQADEETEPGATDETEDMASDNDLADQAEANDPVSEELASAGKSDVADQLEAVSNDLADVDQPTAVAELDDEAEAANALAGTAEPESTLAAEAASGPITLVTRAEHDRLAAEQEQEAQAAAENVAAEAETAETVDIPDVPFMETPDIATEAATTMQIHSDSGSPM